MFLSEKKMKEKKLNENEAKKYAERKNKTSFQEQKPEEKENKEQTKEKENQINSSKLLETENKTEKKKNEAQKTESNKTQKEKKSFPWINAFLFIVMLIFAGLALDKVLNQQEINQSQWNSKESRPLVEIKNFYSSECSFCDKNNSVIANFEYRDINMHIEFIDLALEENKHFIEEFNLKSIPTALINAEQIQEYPFVENLIKEAFTKKNDYYVVSESYLDATPHSIMFLNKIQECPAEQEKVFVEEFCDYQTPGCAMIFEKTKNARETFAGKIIYEHKNYLVHGEASKITAFVAECAKEQGRFFGFNRYLYEKAFPEAFGLQRDPIENYLPEVINAGLVATQMPDLNQFRTCIEEEQPLSKIQDENQLAQEYNIRYIPALVFDCQYVIQGHEKIEKINEIICEIHPELEACKNEENESN